MNIEDDSNCRVLSEEEAKDYIQSITNYDIGVAEHKSKVERDAHMQMYGYYPKNRSATNPKSKDNRKKNKAAKQSRRKNRK